MLENIKDIDFFYLDVEKYNEWLISQYKLFAQIGIVAHLDELIKYWKERKETTEIYYYQTRKKLLPSNIETAYKNKVKHFETQKEPYADLIIKLALFKSVNIEKQQPRPPYIFFTANQLKEVKINIEDLILWNKEHAETFYPKEIKDIETKKNSSPLDAETFYRKQKDEIINTVKFEFLQNIINGEMIYNLDDFATVLRFYTEINRIRVLIYLSEKIKGKPQPKPMLKPIQWHGNINALATIFFELADKKIISSSNENIKRMLLNCFVDAENKVLSKNYLDEIFNTSKGKLSKDVITEISYLISVLSKNSP